MGDQAARLREQRDRFIAFAFAAAEVLLELSQDEAVTYCAGTTDHLFGAPADQMVGMHVSSLVDARDRIMLREMFNRILTAGRMDRVGLRVMRGLESIRVRVSGIAFPDRPGRLYLAVSRDTGQGRNGRGEDSTDIPRTREDFAKMAERRLREAQQYGEDVKMTLVDLAGASIGDRFEPDEAKQFIEGVESYLRAWSVDGNSVGMLDDGKFGIIHDTNLKAGQVTDRIGEIAALFGPAGEGIEIKATTLEMGRESLTQEDVHKALVYTINRFVEEGGEGFAIQSLGDSYAKAIDETLAKVNAFRQTLSSDTFTLVFQPIVDLRSWQVHHYEALARMVQGEKLFLPARFIGFAEEFGVVNEFDLMVVKKGIQCVREARLIRPKAEIAINLSGKSLSNDTFIQQLMLLLVENRDALSGIMFEVTESAELKDLEATNRVLQKLRSFGCRISIDDFGAGAAAFQYLKALQVDYVKIDGSYILDAFTTRHGKPFLKAIAQLAADLGIQSIGEMVEDSRTMWLLRDVGVDYGQGYFFGKPMPDVSQFTLAPRPERPPPADTRKKAVG